MPIYKQSAKGRRMTGVHLARHLVNT